jgi:FXSXX-COOH protein
MKKASPVDPADYVSIVGTTFAKHEHAPVLAFGRHAWTRLDLGRLGVPHTVAAAQLNRVCAELRITTIAGLAEHAAEVGRYKGCGVTTYWLVLAILRSHGYDVKAVHGEEVTYVTLKQRARKAIKERKRKPRRAGPPSESAVH